MEAARATEEIFFDIWQYCEYAGDNQSLEEKLIALIALRRLVKPISYAKQTSMSNIDAANEQGARTDGISERV